MGTRQKRQCPKVNKSRQGDNAKFSPTQSRQKDHNFRKEEMKELLLEQLKEYL